MLESFSPKGETLDFFDNMSGKDESFMDQSGDIIDIQKQMNVLQEQNINLTSELKKTKEKCDDLKYRLDLNIQILDDLKKNKEKEKKEIEDKYKETLMKLKNDYENKSRESNKQIEENKNQLNEKEKKLELNDNDIKKMNTLMNNILIAAQFYFLRTFKDSNEFYNYLKDNQNKQKENLNEKQENANNDKVIEYKKKFKKLKDKFIKLKAQNQESINKIDELKNLNERQKLEYSDKVNKIELSLNKIQKQNLATQNNYKIESEERISEMQNLLEKEREKTKSLQEKLEQKERLLTISQNKINKEKQMEYEKKLAFNVKTSNLALSNQLQDMNNNYKRKIQKLSEENQELKQKNENLNQENSLIKIQLEKANEDSKNLNSQLQASKMQHEKYNSLLNEEKLKIQETNSSFEMLESTLEKQKEEIKVIMQERNKFILFVQKQEEVMKIMEKNNLKLSEKNKEFKRIISEQKIELLSKEPNDTNFKLSLNSSSCKEFPKELCILISNICNSSILPESCKLKNILETIGKYYNEIILRKDKIIENNKIEQEDFHKKLGNLMLSLSSLLQDDLLSQESFLNDPTFDKYISNHISSLVESNVLQTSNNNKLLKDIESINNELKTNSVSETLTKIKGLFSDISQLVNLINKLRVNKNKKKKALITVQELRDKENKQSQYVISKQSAIIAKLKNENNNLTQKYQESIQNNIDIQSSFISKLKDSENEKEDENSRLQSRIEKLQKEFQEKIEIKDNQIKELTNANDKLKSKIFKFKQESGIYKISLDENKKTIEELENRINTPKQQLNPNSQFIQIIDDYKRQNNEIRNLLSNSTKSLKEMENKNQELIGINSNLSIENKQLQTKINLHNEEMNRQTQILNTKYHALQLASSTKVQMEIDEAKAQFSNEKRKLIGYFIKNFSFMFDPSEKLSEDNFKKWVQKYSVEIQKLIRQEQTIRRILGIGQNDSIEQSIIKILSC